MGNNQPSSQQQTQHSLNHPRMRQVKFIKNNEAMMATMSVQDENDFFAWENQLARLKKFDEYYLLLPKVYEFGKKGVCGSSGYLQIEYDNFPYLLHQEIKNRGQIANYFAENELWYLLYGLVSAANAFKEVGTKVGDIQAKNVFLNEVGQIKVSNLCSWPSERTNYQKLIFEHVATYVAPQELELAKEGRMDIYKINSTGKTNSSNHIGSNGGRLDQYTCESFSIGLTMLESALLKPSSTLYNPKQKTLSTQELANRITELLRNEKKTTYSKILRMTIAGLCELDASKRLEALSVYDQLRVHDSQITNLRPCKIEIDVGDRGAYEEVIMYREREQQGNTNTNINTNTYANTYVTPTPNQNMNSINNYSNPNSITGTNSIQYHRNKPIQPDPLHTNTNTNTNTNPYPYTNTNTNTNTNAYTSNYNYNNYQTPNIYSAPSSYTSSYSNQYRFQTTPAPAVSSSYYVPAYQGAYGAGSGSGGYGFEKKSNVDLYRPIGEESRPAGGLEIGSGNSYLYNIYSMPQANKTPTFSSSTYTPTYTPSYAPTYTNTQTTANISAQQPTPNNTTPIAYQTTTPAPTSNTNTNPPNKATQKYGNFILTNPLSAQPPKQQPLQPTHTFSNISSITKQPDSAAKPNPNLAPFTPSKEGLASTLKKSGQDDSSLDFLRRIDQEIMRSKSKFNQ